MSPVPLHFIHHRSSRDVAIPLVFIHGWPSSFHEVVHIINELTDPSDSSLPAFHVVAPDLPGFGFSPAPLHPGFGLREVGRAINNLMKQLEYCQYVGQGGDFGSHTLRCMAPSFRLSSHTITNNHGFLNRLHISLFEKDGSVLLSHHSAALVTITGFRSSESRRCDAR